MPSSSSSRICSACGERNPERARFCMMCSSSLGAGIRREEVRKLVSILFADVKGSTEIAEWLDPEAVRDVLTDFYRVAREILELHGGTVEKFIGDAVMAVFGVPRIHEDDAVRAVRAAAAMQHAMTSMNQHLVERYGVGLQLRIGVNSGEVIAGDPATGSSFVAGDAVNVAARLEQTAAPGDVLIGKLTEELARSVVEVELVDALRLKGKREPVRAYRLLQITEGAAPETIPFHGRTEELADLDREIEQVARGEGRQTLLVTGPAGIGKTRFLEEAARLFGHRSWVISIRCRPDGEADPMEPLADLSRRTETIAGAMVGHPNPASLARAMREAASQRPVLVVIDDAHLAGAGLRRALDDVVQKVSHARVLWVESHRVDDSETEMSRAGRAKLLALAPLSTDHCLAVLTSVAGNIEPALTEQILEAAAGNPLFLIESVRLLAERESTDEAPLELPGTVRALLGARLDGLPDAARTIVECASVLGLTFAFQVLRSLVPEDLSTRASAIVDDLARRGHFATDVEGQISFAHGSMRDVAYGSITKRRRAGLHSSAADVLENDDADAVVVAHHLERAVMLRSELGALVEQDQVLAARAMQSLVAGGISSLSRADRTGATDLLVRALALRSLASAHARDSLLATGDLAFELGRWDDVVATLGGFERDLSNDRRRSLGVALCKRARGGSEEDDLHRGRALLEMAGEEGHDPDAWASLAGTWKGIDDARAAELYARAAALDPGDPYALGNLLEYEIERAGSLSPVRARGVEIAVVTDRCRAQIWSQENLPWAAFDLAKFCILTGEWDEALVAVTLAIARSTAPFMLETSLASIERISAVDPFLPGSAEAVALMKLGLACVFGRDLAGELGDPPNPPLTPPVLIIAGSSSADEDAAVRALVEPLASASRGRIRTIVSGGTTQGVSALAGDVAERLDLPAVGHVPSILPNDVHLDRDPKRYCAIRRTEGATFGPLEPLQYWRDAVASGVAPSSMYIVGVGGGWLSGFEYRLAIALGARVGVLGGSGGAADDLLDDPRWLALEGVERLEPNESSLGAFLQG